MLGFGLALMLIMSGGGEAKPQPAPAAGTKLDPDRMICRREVRIGTLAGFQRTCHTRAEWAKISQESKEPWEQMQGTLGSTNERMAADILTPK